MTTRTFKKEDLRNAAQHQRGSWNCIQAIEENIQEGKYKDAMLSTVDLLNSIKELDRLAEKKVKQDELHHITQTFVNVMMNRS
ncbi:hypothetical protein N5C46_22930 [Rossellomorea vietnamensis]|uniref:Uncharacterized protein n=1 Tax=Rossellomorea vietnamensis TaxID=218284 RepID=A0ACD4C746_9BACI|nr:hypothetical protein [Rossellomorea vietnamensis]UXH44435.1 hypothetical protein N5C46_22930 [Rossellomorea vietnamensis]